MIQYLKTEDYYNDLYDLWTIEECLRIREYWDKRFKDLKAGEIGVARWGINLQLHFVKGERYRNKRTILREWDEADRKRDEKLNQAEEPNNVGCSKCQGTMKVIFKDLYDFDCNSLRVIFFFECLKCGKRRGIFEDGQEYVSKGVKLSKAEMDKWDRDDAERKGREKRDQDLLRQYRSEFCLSETEGEEYILSSNRLKVLADFLKETEQKKADPVYAEAMKLKKLTIVELEKFLRSEEHTSELQSQR